MYMYIANIYMHLFTQLQNIYQHAYIIVVVQWIFRSMVGVTANFMKYFIGLVYNRRLTLDGFWHFPLYHYCCHLFVYILIQLTGHCSIHIVFYIIFLQYFFLLYLINLQKVLKCSFYLFIFYFVMKEEVKGYSVYHHFQQYFSYIFCISWWSVLLVEETGVPGETYRPVASHW